MLRSLGLRGLGQVTRRHGARGSVSAFSRGASTASKGTGQAATPLSEEYKKVAPNLDPPFSPSAFLQSRPEAPSGIPDKLTLNLVVPHELPFWNKQVESVIVPATSGQMGVLPGHVPSIAELKPGVLSVIEEGGAETKFFVSSGFAFVNPNSVLDVCAVEAVPLDQLDPEEVKKGLAHYQAKAASADSELEKAEAQIGVEVHSAMGLALGV